MDSKPQNVANGWFNLKKGSPDDAVEELNEIKQRLLDLGAYISLSFSKTNTKMTAFFNSYKKKDSQPDLVVRMSTLNTQRRAAPPPVEETDEDVVEATPTPKKTFAKRPTRPGASTAPTQTAPKQDAFTDEEIPF